MSEKIILGIDPGTTVMGYGLIKVVNNEMKFLLLNELDLKKYKDHYLKLKLIFNRTLELIENYHPDELALEAPFFGKNVQSMLKLAAGLIRETPIFEYSPKKIKMSITGNGNATKEQVAKMLQNIFNFKKIPKNLDSTDGLAVAVCHYYNLNSVINKSNYKDWNTFLKKNPDKISKN